MRDGSFEAIASRAHFTADLTAVRTDWFRARRLRAWRLRFWADLVLANACPCSRKVPRLAKKSRPPYRSGRGLVKQLERVRSHFP
jgi:hypothetical protein